MEQGGELEELRRRVRQLEREDRDRPDTSHVKRESGSEYFEPDSKDFNKDS